MKTKMEEKYEKWLTALESGEYKQTRGFLCSDKGGGDRSYCCIGVLDKVVWGELFIPNEPWSAGFDLTILMDSQGNESTLDYSRQMEMGLDTRLPAEERAYIQEEFDLHPSVQPGDTRHDVLTALNDGGVSFQLIARTIREMGWHKEESEERREEESDE